MLARASLKVSSLKVSSLRIPLFVVICFTIGFVSLAPDLAAQPGSITGAAPDDDYLGLLQYRSIGPFRGGRSAAVEGVPGKKNTFLMGACGGGVWQTDDGGVTWNNISDGYFGGSIGAVAVAPSDARVIYVGGGEKTVRGNVSSGEGMYKSIDGGKSWQAIGLEDSRHISRIRIDPQNPNLVYVAAMGHLYGPNQQRGVFRSSDGGKNWERVLFVNDAAGAVDLILDPNDSKTIYASTWRVLRTPHSLESGGEGSGLWKSIDGGDTWTDISRVEGLPQGTLGIIGVAVSPVDSNRLWAMIEATDGGLFRSDDAGNSWEKINDDRNLRQRAWYYTRVYAGPQDKNEVYVLNVQFLRSRDGGKTFTSIRTPHGDHHDLWIAPDDPRRMIIADDGGAQVTFDGGATFSTYHNQPTAQFYRVITDNHFPYRIYGAQQDNSTVRIHHRGTGRYLTESDWESTAGGESGHIAPDPIEPEIVYGGSYGGYLQRFDHRNRHTRNITVWPDNPMGYGAGDLKYRFQWNFPIFFSPHHPRRLYAAGNVLFVSDDQGGSWRALSPDLTRNDPSKLGPSGGPITKDNTSVEYYCTLFAAAESQHQPDTIWVGSDDGLIHITRDGGENWENVTPPQMPEWSMINSIEIHPTEPGGLYVAATRYKLNDFQPYLYKTLDYGKTWIKIVDGIEPSHFTRVIRSDPDRAGLLYAGTENGMYVSFDDGGNWKRFQNNLPIVPITDLALKNGDLIVATQGRSFWIIDDLSLLHQWTPGLTSQPVHLFLTRPLYRLRSGGEGEASATAGANLKNVFPIRIWMAEVPADDQPVALAITDPFGKVAHRFVYKSKPSSGAAGANNAAADNSGQAEASVTEEDSEDSDSDIPASSWKLKPGMNQVEWDMLYPRAETFEGMILWGGIPQTPQAAPGRYQIRLSVGEQTYDSEVDLLPDPTFGASVDDLTSQFQFLIKIRDKLTEVHGAIKQIRSHRGKLQSFQKQFGKLNKYQSLNELADELLTEMKEIEEALYQTKNRSAQDPLNYPIRLNNRLSILAGVAAQGDNRPTTQVEAVYQEVAGLIDTEMEKLNRIASTKIEEFNRRFAELAVPFLYSEQK